jgi:hypothetical protein
LYQLLVGLLPVSRVFREKGLVLISDFLQWSIGPAVEQIVVVLLLLLLVVVVFAFVRGGIPWSW